MAEREHVKCLIIGSGPAGYTAAIYASRANLQPVEYCGMLTGGQLTQTTVVENFPGYPEGVDGNQMMHDLRSQAERLGTDIRDGEIVKADLSEHPYILTTDSGVEIAADTVIIATGASAKYLGLDVRRNTADRVFLPVPPATVSSTASALWLWWAVATPPARRPSISLVWRRKSI